MALKLILNIRDERITSEKRNATVWKEKRKTDEVELMTDVAIDSKENVRGHESEAADCVALTLKKRNEEDVSLAMKRLNATIDAVNLETRSASEDDPVHEIGIARNVNETNAIALDLEIRIAKGNVIRKGKNVNQSLTSKSKKNLSTIIRTTVNKTILSTLGKLSMKVEMNRNIDQQIRATAATNTVARTIRMISEKLFHFPLKFPCKEIRTLFVSL